MITLTVGELIKKLKQFDENEEVGVIGQTFVSGIISATKKELPEEEWYGDDPEYAVVIE